MIEFRAPGNSMLPFIRNEDKLTLSPVSKRKPGIGKIVAFIHPGNQKLIVHRIIARNGASYLIKGDNSSLKMDGWINQDQIIGCVTSIVRNAQNHHFGLGIERYLIAYLSKHNLLIRITRRF
jgi:phage repressor protein C with HTH and peptisase S24 domain